MHAAGSIEGIARRTEVARRALPLPGECKVLAGPGNATAAHGILAATRSLATAPNAAITTTAAAAVANVATTRFGRAAAGHRACEPGLSLRAEDTRA